MQEDLWHLSDGDVIQLRLTATLRSLYRVTLTLIFVCWNNAIPFVMCSRRQVDDTHLIEELIAAIPLFDHLRQTGITGGEPTLLGEKFRAIKDNKELPAQICCTY